MQQNQEMIDYLKNHSNVARIETVDTGGGELADIITLLSGVAIVVTTDCMVAYMKGKDAFYAAMNGESVEYTVIY
jgi:hypothetical protein